MSTRSAILEKTDAGYRGIYCHSDGYVTGVGKMLVENFTDPAKVSALIDLGDISYLEENLVPTESHSFDHPQEGVVVAYGRDRGETGTKAVQGKTIKAVAKKIDHAYLYVFEDGHWSVDGKSIDALLLKLES